MNLSFLPIVILGLLGVGLIGFSGIMPRKTRKGAIAGAQIQAFKRYLEQIERYDNVAQARERFEEYLPYAIAFGIEKRVVRQFEAVQTPAPLWYVPYGYGYGYGYGTAAGSAEHGSIGDAGGGGGGGFAPPSLDTAAGGAFAGLDRMSSGLFSMLNETASTFTSASSTFD
ncbi:MAG: DUF2207 domain-containing protein [Chloroflexaceae bacterium]|nr:DUF2207 domain-containing protein [Chloroflexaceae bacterium]